MRLWTTRRTTLQAAWTYTLIDLAGACWGVLVFASAVLFPGYVLLRLFASHSLAKCSAREQLAWSVALSFGPGVLLLAGVVALGGASAGAALLFVVSFTALWFARRSLPIAAEFRPYLTRTFCIFAAWTAVVLLSLVDFGTRHSLWMSVSSYDHGLRTAFVDAVLRTGAPPVDPVYWPGHDVPMRYYYFWYEVCAAVARLAHISGRQALMASCVWPAVGVVAMLALFARHLLGRRGKELTRLLVVASALLTVCGLDLLVTIALHFLGTPMMPDMEWWAIDQVASWPDTFLWVPHHAAALVAALLGLLLLLRPEAIPGKRHRLLPAAIAGMSFAAAFGMSAYIAVAAALVAAAAWWLNLRGGSRWTYLRDISVAAFVSGSVLCRFLYQLAQSDGKAARHVTPLYVGVREILDPTALAGSSLFRGLTVRHPWGAREFAALVLLVPGWAVELGFFAVALGVVLWRFRQSLEAERTLCLLAISGLIASSFLRSNVIVTNDYGIRAALLAQFFLVVIGALVFETSAGKFRRFLWLLLAIGVGASAYQLIELRFYVPWQQAAGNVELREVGEHTLALRAAYADLQARVPPRARLQFDPAETGYYLYSHLSFSGHQLITAEVGCSTSFGGDPAACPAIQAGLTQLFPRQPTASLSMNSVQQLCRALGLEYLVATRWDAIWNVQTSWVWELQPILEQPSVRVLSCGR